jgi:septin family protein
MVKIGNKITRGRQYEWGSVSVENESHCDFMKLREMILSTNMLDLIELTHTKHYQMYRSARLKELGFVDEQALNETDESKKEKQVGARTIHEVYNQKKKELNEEIQRKEKEIKENFIQKVKDKEVEIREAENSVS